MTALDDAIASLRAWRQPPGGDNPFALSCRFEEGAQEDEIAQAAAQAPEEVIQLWRASREMWLFEDAEYGQWGLHLMAPQACLDRTSRERADRPAEFDNGDLVVGEFLGDSEVLVCAAAESSDRRWLVALPMDPRSDWYPAGDSLAAVLEQLVRSDGDKYWE